MPILIELQESSLHYEYQIYNLSMLTAILMYRCHQNAVVIIHNSMHQFILFSGLSFVRQFFVKSAQYMKFSPSI